MRLHPLPVRELLTVKPGTSRHPRVVSAVYGTLGLVGAASMRPGLLLGLTCAASLAWMLSGRGVAGAVAVAAVVAGWRSAWSP
jgi:hypothetical protein